MAQCLSEPEESDLKEERTMNRKVFNSGELLNYMLPKLNMLLDIAIRRIWSENIRRTWSEN